MDYLSQLVFSLEGLILLAFVVTIIFLIFRRIKERQNEDFEERDN